ncbi:tRNA lysidine(34) synthetase TilS [Candidatus Latescibacterota bacterium]
MYCEFEQKVSTYCKKYSLFPDNVKSTVLVALSGGGDSVALLHVLNRIKDEFDLTIEAAHLNHSLRGEESAEDENFCVKLCKDLGIQLTVERLHPCEIPKSPDSVETAARNTRIAFLQRIAEDHNAERIATGHTLNDQAETVIQRLLRGTGPSGLVGILPIRDDLWIRPLLMVTRDETRDYLETLGITFREDSTNSDTSFFRNRIRHELIPSIKEHFSPNITAVIGRLAELSRIREEYLEKLMMDAFRDCCILENRYKILLDKIKLINYHKVLKQLVVRYCLRRLEGAGRNADMDEVTNTLDLLNSESGTIDITSSLKCGAGKNTAAFVMHTDHYDPVPLELPGETVIPMGGGSIITEKASTNTLVDGRMTVLVSIDLARKYGTLTVGPLRSGELMSPFGLNREVKIRDLVSASPLPKVLRELAPVVRAGAVPIWIPGLRSSEYLRIPDYGSRQSMSGDILYMTLKDGIKWL